MAIATCRGAGSSQKGAGLPPARARLDKPWGGRGLVARLVFKTSRAVQPTAWKVRFLRRLVASLPDPPEADPVRSRRPSETAHRSSALAVTVDR